MRVRSVRRLTGKHTIRVYDITVDGTHCYFANDVLVHNSKRISLLDVNAMLSHGATENLLDAGAIRGQRNDAENEFWPQFMMGYTPQAPRVPLVYEKFVNQLRSAGVNVVRHGSQTNVMAMTDRDVDAMTGDRELKSGETVHFDKGLRPVAGGLFDPKLTGGHGGRNWSFIKLHEPMPNPVMEEPIRRVLGLTQKKFEGVLSGTESLDDTGTGPGAITRALDRINIDREMAHSRAQIEGGSMTTRSEAIKRLRLLKHAQARDLHPRDWVLRKVPVLPPAFRPVSVMGESGIPLVSDPNYLYKELLEANHNLRDMEKDVGVNNTGPERLAVYHAFKAVTGLADPLHPKLQEKNVQGVLKSIFGSSPKFGTVQRKLISSTVDAVGRAVIVPNPDFDMDTIGIPENKAFEVYKKLIVRRLKRRGMPMTQAMRHIEDKSPLAREALVEEMDDRPVFVNRAPVLHKFGIMAFKPRLVSGEVLQVSPLITKGFNADFDGDAMQFHVPISEPAKREALERMLPSKSLISPADFKKPMHSLEEEYMGGVYYATSEKNKRRPRTFRNKQDVIAAYERGDLSVDDQIHILEQ